MKHNISYIFNPDDIHSVADVAAKLREISLGHYAYQKYKMADGTVHQFIVTEDEHVELPDLDAALAWVVGDINKLQNFFMYGYVIKEETEHE